ncbi:MULTISPECIES: histidine kinase [unclassified Curtobacterium]|uniref:histidine kinase n=1 Tax=unclassified Curtobacterium TaxID=257496 RepID=UPI000DA7AB33|nr:MULTISPECIES: histidine kinase [unclassified Curtobacterium]WIB63838.1 histidine kinase [Curtobacterium sp. MCBD17_040]WIB67679.1 histidine kinase [Curtobacterium sp. MCBD17_035]
MNSVGRPGTGSTDALLTDRNGVGSALNLVGVVVVAWSTARSFAGADVPVLVVVATGVALLAWAVRLFLPGRAGPAVAAVVMVLLAAPGVMASSAALVAPIMVALVVLGADLALPVWLGPSLAAVAAVIVAVVAAVEGVPALVLLGVLAGLAVAVLIGVSRRQARLARRREEALAHRVAEAEAEQQRSALLADRARVARDVHDVLAHGLGGLVLQLDAVEALLEAGRTAEGTAKAADARRLAADSLVEARRAVAALHDPEGRDGAAPSLPAASGAVATRTAMSGSDVSGAATSGPVDAGAAVPDPGASGGGLVPLVAAHRSFGGAVLTEGDLSLRDLDDAHRAVVVAAAREALSNARRHAPGATVELSVVHGSDAVDVVVTNPLASGGHGLVGMRERFAELGDGSVVRADRTAGEFVVSMHVPHVDGGPRS